MADAVGREESKISLARKGKENTVILATKSTTDSCPCNGSHTEIFYLSGVLEKDQCIHSCYKLYSP